MAKVTIDPVTSGYNLSKINANLQLLADELNNKVLYRDNPVGEPNALTGDVDLNSNDILNVNNLHANEAYVDGIPLAVQVANAAASAAAALVSETNAAASEANASSSASAAALSETNAAASEAAAALSESNASTSETNAAASEAAAALSETNAAASEASTIAVYDAFDDRFLGAKATPPTLDNDGDPLQTGAQYFYTVDNTLYVWTGSAWATGVSTAVADAAAASAAAALVSETNAAASETAAALSETNAAASEAAAALSESNAATSETNAADSEAAAALSESNAATSETNATASEAAAALSETNAAASEVAAAASYDAFDDRYLGSKTSDPTLDNDGNPLLDGALYWNSVAAELRVYDLTGTAWQSTAYNSTNVNITGGTIVNTTVDGRNVGTDGSKLDGIEAGATADQTASEILTLLKTVDGVSSGLDADLVRGTTAAINNTLTTEDLNTVTTSGMYRMQSSHANQPSGTVYGQLLVIHGGADTIAQIASDYAGNYLYFRSGNPSDVGGFGSWSAWRKVWHDGNTNWYTNDAIGANAWLIRTTLASSITAGTSYAGSGLRFAGYLVTGAGAMLGFNSTTAPTGTWLALGSVTGQSTYYPATLFVRIA